ncbi:MAG: YIP1 family protein [Deltaproteobacteria bacterium]|nr:YIP1 family protein [Deltaproteobacteria bacterium]
MEQPLFGQFTIGFVFLFLMVLVPVGIIVAMFVYSAVLHLFLLMVRGGKNGFEATFRVIAYSQAAQGFSVVPVIGGWIAGIWQFVVQVIGLREIHGVSYLRVIMAFILPVLILFVLTVTALIPLVLFITQHWSGHV